jgi:hypothetical protein
MQVFTSRRSAIPWFVRRDGRRTNPALDGGADEGICLENRRCLDGSAGKRPGQHDETGCERTRGQEDEILELLRKAGQHGCTNAELWTVCHAVNSRISDLRRRGHHIEALCEGRGVWRYRLIEPVPPQPDPQKAGKSPANPGVTLPLFAGVRE